MRLICESNGDYPGGKFMPSEEGGMFIVTDAYYPLRTALVTEIVFNNKSGVANTGKISTGEAAWEVDQEDPSKIHFHSQLGAAALFPAPNFFINRMARYIFEAQELAPFRNTTPPSLVPPAEQ